MKGTGRAPIGGIAVVRCPRADSPRRTHRQKANLLFHQRDDVFSARSFHGPSPFEVDGRGFRRFGPDDELHHGIPCKVEYPEPVRKDEASITRRTESASAKNSHLPDCRGDDRNMASDATTWAEPSQRPTRTAWGQAGLDGVPRKQGYSWQEYMKTGMFLLRIFLPNLFFSFPP